MCLKLALVDTLLSFSTLQSIHGLWVYQSLKTTLNKLEVVMFLESPSFLEYNINLSWSPYVIIPWLTYSTIKCQFLMHRLAAMFIWPWPSFKRQWAQQKSCQVCQTSFHTIALPVKTRHYSYRLSHHPLLLNSCKCTKRLLFKKRSPSLKVI